MSDDWDDDDQEELKPLKPFRPAIPRAGHDDRPRPRPRPSAAEQEPARVGGTGGGGPRLPHRPTGGPADGGHGPEPGGWTPPRQALFAAIGGVALIVVILLVSSCGAGDDERDAEQAVVDQFLSAFASRDYQAMFDSIDTDAQRVYPVKRFAGLNRDAYRLATGESIETGGSTRDGNEFVAPISIRTKLFGTIEGDLRLRVLGSGNDARIAWSRSLAFPGLRTGERLTRQAQIPTRGTIMFRDGKTPIAQGRDRRSSAPADVVKEIRGAMGPIPESDRAAYQAKGIPANTQVGVSGLERLLNDDLVGTPGLTLKAGDRVLGRQKAIPPKTVVSSVSLPVMEAAVQAQASAPSGGGLTAIDTRTGEVLAFSGDAWQEASAPGSTMKIITAAAALKEGSTTTDEQFPVATSALGIRNADGESCGGTLVEAFAQSCNSVFAPLAVKVGSTPFVKMAEAFGFNRTPPVDGAVRSRIPDDLDDADLALSGIGQSSVRATPLQVAMMATTVATGGDQPVLTFRRTDAEAKVRNVIDTSVASDLLTMMEAVVSDGTGTSAQIPDVTVAGKTGTAEIGTCRSEGPSGGGGTGGTDGTTTRDGASTDGAAYRGRRGALLRPAGLTLAQGTTTDGGADPDALDDPPTTSTDDADPTTTDDTTTEETPPDDSFTDPVDPTTTAPPDTSTTICDPNDSSDTDAWMAAFAPSSGGERDPVAVGVLRRGDGQGGATAAPVARAVLQAALKK
ncbi:penicillin-binding transpeptidase domain-containing protein [Patulibacter minatonensis]|uniref:penicillin-binding transpeptidase domain-containing protein n=1 Tax=Patulibacter minatonensis TaxID=298163 RepID=UPI0004BBA11B|nr:penicillin-binding transpeptidase domain-containing protein [Patulibacter minatonensis]